MLNPHAYSFKALKRAEQYNTPEQRSNRRHDLPSSEQKMFFDTREMTTKSSHEKYQKTAEERLLLKQAKRAVML